MNSIPHFGGIKSTNSIQIIAPVSVSIVKAITLNNLDILWIKVRYSTEIHGRALLLIIHSIALCLYQFIVQNGRGLPKVDEAAVSPNWQSE